MKRKWLAIGIILLFVGTCIIPAIAQDIEKSPPTSRGSWLYVGGSGPGNYSRIQDAINDSSDGDTVFVFAGLYIELVTVNRSINLIGENKNTTIIDGNNPYYLISTVTIIKDDVFVTNFTIQNGHFSGIKISSNNNKIVNNIITKNGGGIRFSVDFIKLKDNLIRDNQIINNGCGIATEDTTYTIISHNIIKNGNYGFSLWEHNNIISNNLFENVSYSEVWDSDNSIENNVFISTGTIKLYFASRINIKNNTFIDSQGIEILATNIGHWDTHTIEDNSINGKPIYYYKHASGIIVPSDAAEVILVGCTYCVITDIVFREGIGILLAYSSYNTISRNTIKKTTEMYQGGIYLENSLNNNLSFNSITDCEYGITLYNSSNNCIYRNIIKNNIQDGILCYGSSNTLIENHIADNGVGMELMWASDTIIKNNNFVNNRFHASFSINFWGKHSNKWQSNFYSPQMPRIIKIIIGVVRTPFYFLVGEFPQYRQYIWRPGFNIDWNPAQEPYDIPGMR